MKTLKTINLTETKQARICDEQGLFTVLIEQHYNGEKDVLQVKTYKTLNKAISFALSWV